MRLLLLGAAIFYISLTAAMEVLLRPSADVSSENAAILQTRARDSVPRHAPRSMTPPRQR